MSVVGHAVVLAAGRGERLRPHTETTPKPLFATADGRSMLEHQIRWIGRFAESVSVTVGYMAERVSEVALASGANEIIHVGDRGNAAWIQEASVGDLAEPVLVLTSDNLMELDVAAVVTEFRASDAWGMLVGVDVEPGVAGDRLSVVGGAVDQLERGSVGGRVACGLQVLDTSRAREVSPRGTDFREYWESMMLDGRLVSSTLSPTAWISVDRPEDLVALARWRRDDSGK